MKPHAKFGGIVILIDGLDIELENDSPTKKSTKQWKLIHHYCKKNGWKYEIEYVPSNGIHALTIKTSYGQSQILKTINKVLQMSNEQLKWLVEEEEKQCHTKL